VELRAISFKNVEIIAHLTQSRRVFLAGTPHSRCITVCKAPEVEGVESALHKRWHYWNWLHLTWALNSGNARGQGDRPTPNSPASEKCLNVVGYIEEIVRLHSYLRISFLPWIFYIDSLKLGCGQGFFHQFGYNNFF
jgi:hypothetical protein